MPTVSCPRGQDKPGGTFYPGVKCRRGQDTAWYLVPGDNIPWGQVKPVHRPSNQDIPGSNLDRGIEFFFFFFFFFFIFIIFNIYSSLH